MWVCFVAVRSLKRPNKINKSSKRVYLLAQNDGKLFQEERVLDAYATHGSNCALLGSVCIVESALDLG